MQHSFPALSAFVDYLFDCDVVTARVAAASAAPWGDVPFTRDEVVAELTRASQVAAGAGPWTAFKAGSSYGKVKYWSEQAPGVKTVIGTGGIALGTKSAARWEAFCTDDAKLIYADLRLIPLQ